MKKPAVPALFIALLLLVSVTACGSIARRTGPGSESGAESGALEAAEDGYTAVTETVTALEDGLSAVSFSGSDGFDTFLEAGGASSDADVLAFLMEHLLSGENSPGFGIQGGGCSTVSVPSSRGEGYCFGRNFDWNPCDALILISCPESGYRSISTVNTDFIRQASQIPLSDRVLTTAALYAPLDGMNEMGLCVSVNMIQDSATIEQNTVMPDLTTTTAVRLLLNRAATVDEAVELLKGHDLHASFGYMVHFAIADAAGNSVAAEYVGGELSVVRTQVLTNFYLTEGDKYGVGTSQSHTRYDLLMDRLREKPSMSAEDVRDALSSVSKGNFGEFESTEWSVVYDQTLLTAVYYHRENYETAYRFRIPDAVRAQ